MVQVHTHHISILRRLPFSLAGQHDHTYICAGGATPMLCTAAWLHSTATVLAAHQALHEQQPAVGF